MRFATGMPPLLAGLIGAAAPGAARAQAAPGTPALATPAPATAAAAVSVDKSVPTFSSLSDGQPNDPGQFSISALGGYSAGDWQGQAQFQYTPKGDFWSNALFTATLPSVTAGGNVATAETSATFSWQQRWFGANDSRTNIMTSIAIQVPVDEPGQDVDYIATAGITQLMGKGIGYLNAYVETQSGPANPAPTEWGLIAGYKHPVSTSVEVIGDALYSQGDNLQLEASVEIDASSALTLGPGAFLATDLDDGDVTAGVGLVLGYSF